MLILWCKNVLNVKIKCKFVSHKTFYDISSDKDVFFSVTWETCERNFFQSSGSNMLDSKMLRIMYLTFYKVFQSLIVRHKIIYH